MRFIKMRARRKRPNGKAWHGIAWLTKKSKAQISYGTFTVQPHAVRENVFSSVGNIYQITQTPSYTMHSPPVVLALFQQRGDHKIAFELAFAIGPIRFIQPHCMDAVCFFFF